MATISETAININLAFPKAGVTFVVECIPPDTASGDDSHSFKITASSSEHSSELAFTEDTSPQLADWIKGYSRWLVRANVTASFNDQGINGKFRSGLSPEQVLSSVNDACDMIRQRFDHYETSVLA